MLFGHAGVGHVDGGGGNDDQHHSGLTGAAIDVIPQLNFHLGSVPAGLLVSAAADLSPDPDKFNRGITSLMKSYMESLIESLKNDFRVLMGMAKTKHQLIAVCGVFAVWGITHFFTLDWGLPNLHSFAQDATCPKITLDARGMMSTDAYKYPPLQYLIFNVFLSPQEKKPGMTLSERCQLRSRRIYVMRWIVSVMSLTTALAIMFFLVWWFKLRSHPFEYQLLCLEAYKDADTIGRQLKIVGYLYDDFTPIDLTRYYIEPETVKLLMRAYLMQGRKEQAAKITRFVNQILHP